MPLPIVSSNNPVAGSISWSATSVRFDGSSYPIAPGTTATRFVYFKQSTSTAATTFDAAGNPTNGTGVVVKVDVLPGQVPGDGTSWDPKDTLLFLNRNGTGVYAFDTQVIDGSLIVSGSILTDAIAANQITVAQMKANSVDTAQLVTNSVKSAQIAAGQVNANHISAGSISADKLTIGAFGANLAPNPFLEDWDALNTFPIGWQALVGTGWGQVTTKETVTANVLSGGVSLGITPTAGNQGSFFMSRSVPCVAGNDIYLGAYFQGTGASMPSGVLAAVYFFNAAGALLAVQQTAADITGGNAVDSIQHTAVAPATAKSMTGVFITASPTKVIFDNIEMGYRTTTIKLADGAITAQKIKSGEIWVGSVPMDALTPGASGTADVGSTTLQASSGTGSSVQINSGGITLKDATGTAVVILPTDISDTKPATFEGQVRAASFTSATSSSIGGAARFEPKSTTTIASSITAPGTAPTYTIDWPTIQLTGMPSSTGWNTIGLRWDATNTRWIRLQYGAGTNQIRAQAFSTAGVYLSQVAVISVGAAGSNYFTATYMAGNIYVFASAWSGAAPYDKYIIGGNGHKLEMPLLSNNSGLTVTAPGIGVNSTNDRLLIETPSTAKSGSPVATPNNRIILEVGDNLALGTNIITNTGFETDTSNWAAGSNTTITRVTAAGTFHSGVAALQVNNTVAGTTSTVTYGGTGVSGVPILAGASYDISFWLRSATATVRSPTITFNVYNAAGTLLSNTNSNIWANNDSTTYGKYSGSGYMIGADMEAAFCQFKFTFDGLSGTDIHYLDDFVIQASAGLNVTAAVKVAQITTRIYNNAAVGVMKGAFDGGTTRYAIGPGSGASANDTVNVVTTAGALSTNDNFPVSNAGARGIDWDGTSFTSVSGDTLYQHLNTNLWTTESPTWWIGSTYQDTTASFLYETSLSNLQSFFMMKRARLTVISPAIPLGAAASADPKTAGTFLGRGTTAPAYSAMFYQGNTAPVTGATKSIQVITAPTWTGNTDPVTGLLTAPNPASNPKAFPAATPATLVSAGIDSVGSLITLNGDGSGRVGPLSWNSSGAYIPMAELAPTLGPTSYPIGNSMFQTSVTGWPELLGMVVTDYINASRGKQTYYAKSGNYYTRSADTTGTNGWTAWTQVGGPSLDSGWVTFTPGTGDAPFGGAVTRAQYRQIGKEVYFRFNRVTNAAFNPGATDGNYGNANLNNATTGLLPAAVCPDVNTVTAARFDDVPVSVVVQPSGLVTMTGGLSSPRPYASGVPIEANGSWAI